MTRIVTLCIGWCLITEGLWHVFGRQLHFVNVLYRHGDRSPIVSYPNSLYQEDFWPQGFGELSEYGIQMQYKLGKYLRDRYSTLLSSNYSRYEIYVRSSAIDRTIMSAQANLAGLYPPNSNQMFNPDILWQPIPVYPPLTDLEGYVMGKPPCPKYDKLLADTVQNNPGYRKLSDDNAEFLKNVSRNAGFSHTLTVNESCLHLRDPLHCEQLHSLTLPDWATDYVMNKLNYLATENLHYSFITKEMRRLRTGGLVSEIVGNMLRSQSTHGPENKRRKMSMYATHETVLAPLLLDLGVYNRKIPPYSACVCIELIEEDEGSNEYTVELWYYNDTKVDPYKLTMPGCNFSCPLRKFVELTRDIALLPDEVRKECEADTVAPCHNLNLVIGITFAVCVLIAGIVALLCRFVYSHCPKTQQNEYDLIER